MKKKAVGKGVFYGLSLCVWVCRKYPFLSSKKCHSWRFAHTLSRIIPKLLNTHLTPVHIRCIATWLSTISACWTSYSKTKSINMVGSCNRLHSSAFHKILESICEDLYPLSYKGISALVRLDTSVGWGGLSDFQKFILPHQCHLTKWCLYRSCFVPKTFCVFLATVWGKNYIWIQLPHTESCQWCSLDSTHAF